MSNHLTRFPNYSAAKSVETLLADELSENIFRAKYIKRCKPVLIRGACAHWPAMKKWSVDYLSEKANGATVDVRRIPRIEFRSNPKCKDLYAENDKVERMTIEEFAKVATAKECGPVWLHSYNLTMDFKETFSPANPFYAFKARSKNSPFLDLADDVGAFRFLPEPAATRAYPSKRIFAGRNTYTDWHFHPVDEALMCQLKGTKEVLLLPPDKNSFQTMSRVNFECSRNYDMDIDKYPDLAELKPLRVIVHPGDALFIPINWWHAVESLNDEIVMTVAYTFRSAWSAMFDLRFPHVRHALRSKVNYRNLPLIPLGVAAATLTGLSNRIRGN